MIKILNVLINPKSAIAILATTALLVMVIGASQNDQILIDLGRDLVNKVFWGIIIVTGILTLPKILRVI